MKADVVIVGARCAGAATALLLARAGARVVVVDRGRYGSDTLSTHALMRGAVLQLHRWGVLPSIVEQGTPAVKATRFSYSHEDVTIPIEPKYGVDALYAPRRTLLDGVLSAMAVESGAEVAHGVSVDGLLIGGGRVRGVTAISNGQRHNIEADLVIGADGLYSTVARRVDAVPIVRGTHAAGVLYSYWSGLHEDAYRWIFRPRGSVGAIPTNGGTCVFVSVPAAEFRDCVNGEPAAAYRRMLRTVCPEFAAGLEGATQLEGVRGFGGHPGFIKQSTGPGWALVGDAGYFKDPATAHGITDALRDAELLARAVIVGTADAMEQFEETRFELSQRLFEVTDEIASFPANEARLQELHREFSREMSREVRALAELGPLPGVSPPAGNRLVA